MMQDNYKTPFKGSLNKKGSVDFGNINHYDSKNAKSKGPMGGEGSLTFQSP
jgi:hypothetical protein